MEKRTMGSKFLAVGLCLIVCLSVLTAGCSVKPQKEYGVFLGINAEQRERLDDYHLVVIEPSEFQAEHIRELHAEGKRIFGYINVGAMEEYRPFYDRFQHLTMDVYENWPDERWIDVSSPAWQSFLVDELGKRYADMGLDGFFLDNTDVYYHYPTEEVFQGLCAILKGLKGYDIPLIINGGDFFVSKCIDEGLARSLFDGINQETVFTSIDFENGSYGIQEETETLYFQDYMARAKDCGLTVYLLEYGATPVLSEEIDHYCRKNGFLWYNAESLELQ